MEVPEDNDILQVVPCSVTTKMYQYSDVVVPVINIETDTTDTHLQFFSKSSPSCSETTSPTTPEDILLETIAATLDEESLKPLIKEELKNTIQLRRLIQGKNELQVNFEPPEKYELSEEEKIKVVKRREQNRLAAQRFRDKQKELGSKLKMKIQKLESKNTELMTDIKYLRAEKDELVRRMKEHIGVCPYARLVG